MDCISDHLAPYLLDVEDEQKCDEQQDEEKQWIVSFEKISFLFPNLKQIHFLNLYRFDNIALERLVEWIGNDRCKLEQIKFIYNDFVDSLNDCNHFVDPKQLNKQLTRKLETLKW